MLVSESIPIAKLAWGVCLCLNFHYNKINPSLDFLGYKESYERDLVTLRSADTFRELVEKLTPRKQ